MAILTASPILAQATDSTSSIRLPDADLRLRPGMTVHVAAPSVGQLEATLVDAHDRDLVLRAGGTERTVHLEAGDSLWVLGHLAAKGAKAGAITGLVVTGTLFTLFRLTCRDGTDDPCTGEVGFITLGVVLAGTGALMGAGIGRATQRWERRWP